VAIKKAKQIGFAFIFFIAFSSVFGQNIDLKFHKFNQEQGLSQVSVSCIAQDSKHFIWIGTQDGLNKFDGYKFKVFKNDRADTLSLPNNSITGLFCDNYNRIWIATEKGLSILSLKNEIFKTIDLPVDNLSSNENKPSLKFLKGNGNFLIACSNNNELYLIKLIDVENFKIELISKNFNGIINSLTIANDEEAFIGIENEGFLLFNLKTKSFVKNNDIANLKNVVSMIQSKTSNWIATNNSIYKINNNFTIQKSYLNIVETGDKINTIIEDGAKDLWIGTNSGLIKFESVTENFFQYKSNFLQPQSLSNNRVISLLEDNGGTIWIGTENGLNNFDRFKKNFKVFNQKAGIANTPQSSIYWSILPIDEENTWAGNENGILVIKEKQKIFFELELKGNKGEKNVSVFSLAKDGNIIWAGTNKGLFEIEKESYKYHEFNLRNKEWNEIKQEKILTIKIIEDNIWLGTTNGLYIFNKHLKNLKHYKSLNKNNSSLSKSTIRTIVFDNKKNLWLGSDGEGLIKIENQYEIENLKFTSFVFDAKNKTSISNDIILCALHEGDNLWLGTFGGGLNSFNTKTKRVEKVYTEKDGISNNSIYGIVMDNHKNLWFSTNNGLNCFVRKENKFNKYFLSDGLQSNEFNTGAYAKGFNGELFFGGLNGVTSFVPSKIIINPIAPAISITNVKIFNTSVKGSNKKKDNRVFPYVDTIYLSYKEKFISIEFSSLHYSSPEKNEYEYFLEGWDESWNYIGTNNEATFSNLDPGEYVFRVRGSNSNGVWSKNETKLFIIIKPPFYKTWWFRISISVILIILIISWNRSRVKKIIKQKRILENLVQERTQKITSQATEIKNQNQELENEKEKLDKLLLNILPQETVDELKSKGKAAARNYRIASVMFTDFIGFTRISQNYRPKQLVSELDECFSEFDNIIDKYNLEKIKTIGDAYMCAGGVPIRNVSNPFDIILAALEIQDYIKYRNKIKIENGEKPWELRIGINTGELVAGVIGTKRFAFDVWGDTVNVANRLEANSEAGKVNISNTTYELVKDFFECSFRGKINTKNRGLIEMYFVERIRDEYAPEENETWPGKKFREKLNTHLYGKFNYKKAEQQILKKLEDGLPAYFYYHNLQHTIDVRNSAEEIAKQEKIPEEEIMLLKTAAMFHDSGFLVQYDNNEEKGCEIARELLPQHGFSSLQIETICRLILSTKVPQKPQDILEMIMCDADLDYLGTDNFEKIANNLKKELMWVGKIKTDQEWDLIQIKFLKSHSYFTDFSKQKREEKKLESLRKLIKKIEKSGESSEIN
jgi:ligand-binding sensor domain-containing protein/class 3 adenylate cyclase/predicted metal-dependent HD superfamily phosphohydrolase